MLIEEPLNLYLVAPEGYEERSSVIAAPDKDTAKAKAVGHPAISELVDDGVKLTILDISTGLAKQGYSVIVSKVGMFH